MFDNPYDYQKFLMQHAFANEDGVLLRKKLHDLYTVPEFDLPQWVLNRVVWRGDEKILDVGSGPGVYLPMLFQSISPDQYIGGDLSLGMIQALKSHAPIQPIKSLVFDVEYFPFPDNSFDVVMANHVLEYVPDIDRALQEIRRVLKYPKGLLVTATDSEGTMPEFHTLMQRAVRLLRRGTGEELNEFAIPNSFSLEHGTSLLSKYFPAVARYDIPSTLIFQDAKPVTEYMESSRPFYEPKLPPSIAWEEFMSIMSDQIRRLVDHFGELVVNKLSGVLIATDSGGFAEEYQKRLTKG